VRGAAAGDDDHRTGLSFDALAGGENLDAELTMQEAAW
jgi:hypothetical protein